MKTTIVTQMLLALVVLSVIIISQTTAQKISSADSAAYAAAQNDTTSLRQIAIKHKGDRIAARAQNRLGKIALDSKREDDAERDYLATYRQYINTPEAATAAYNLGKIKCSKGKLTEAKTYFNEYLKTNPTGKSVDMSRFYLLRIMSETKDPNFSDSVHAYFSTPHAAAQAKDVIVQYDLMYYYAEKEDFSQALAEAKKLVKNYPDTKYASFAETQIADYYFLLGQSQTAIDYCNTLLKKYPPNSEGAARVQRVMASIHANNNEFDLSRAEYANAVKKQAKGTQGVNRAEYGLAIIDMQEGRTKNDTTLLNKALQKMKAFVRDHPKDPWVSKAQMNIADLRVNSGNYQDALTAYDGIITFDASLIPKGKAARHSNIYQVHLAMVVQARISKGMLLRMQMQRPADAIAEYDAVLAENSANTDALLNKALCLVDLGQKEKARTILEKLVQDGTDVKEAARQILKSL